ncbi:hypothetical protein [Nannocystis pusilla]|uniref:hypothetical protein n=1 Tax=Nannocystis pusilla TaxID=889268 RepID=UPI003B7F4A2A
MLALAALVFVRLSSAASSVAAPPVDLTWQAPRECPDGDDVLLMVAGLLRQPTGDDAPGRAVARGLVTRAGATWSCGSCCAGGAATTAAPSAPRAARSSRAAALLIAIHLDPLAVTRSLPAAAVVPPAPRTCHPICPPGQPRSRRRAPPTCPRGHPRPPRPVRPPTCPRGHPLLRHPTRQRGRTHRCCRPTHSRPTRPAPPRSLPLPTCPSSQPSPPLPPAGSPRLRPRDRPPARRARSPPRTCPKRQPSSPPRERPPAASSRVLGHLRLEGGLDVGVLPGVGGLVGLFGGVTLPRLRLEAGLVGAPGRILPGVSGRPGGRFDRLGGVVRICPTWNLRPALAVLLCAGLEVGALHGVARDVTVPSPRWAPWASFFLGPALRWRVAGPLGLWLAVEGLVAVNRPIFTVGDEEVYRGGRAGLRTTFGLDLQFGPRNR